LGGKPCPCASADLNDILPTGDENRKGKKKKKPHRPRHEQSDIYQLILGDGDLQSVPHKHISSQPSSPVDIETFTHNLYQAHSFSNSNGIQVWSIKTDT
jgi:hypothetical protein